MGHVTLLAITGTTIPVIYPLTHWKGQLQYQISNFQTHCSQVFATASLV